MTPQNRKDLVEYAKIIKHYLGVAHPVILKFGPVKGGFGRHIWSPEKGVSTIILSTASSVDQLIGTLTHELTHARQWANGDMKWHGGSKRSFRGVYYHNVKEIPHGERPWEMEAYAEQAKMLKMLNS